MKRLLLPYSLVLLLLVPLAACAPLHGEGWLADSDGAMHDGYGAWVELSLLSQPDIKPAGELLAVSQDSLYFIDLSTRPTFRAVGRGEVKKIQGNYYDRGSYAAAFVAEGVAGSVFSIITTGAFSIILMPAYIISTIIGGSVSSYYSYISYDGSASDWIELAMYARFPTGLPPNYDRATPKTKHSQPR